MYYTNGQWSGLKTRWTSRLRKLWPAVQRAGETQSPMLYPGAGTGSKTFSILFTLWIHNEIFASKQLL